MNALIAQLINLFASGMLILTFAMLSQRRILTLIHLFTLQGLAVVGATAVVAYVTHQHHLYYSAALTLILKVILIPILLHRLIDRLNVRWDVETLINIPTLMLVGIVVVVFAFDLTLPISKLSTSVARGTLGIALACVLLSFMIMITRAKAVAQVIGFLAMENSLFHFLPDGDSRLTWITGARGLIGNYLVQSAAHLAPHRRLRAPASV